MPSAHVAPFYAGMHTRFLFILDTSQVPVDVEKWSVKLNVTKVNDGVCGEPRDRLWRYVNWWDVNITCKQVDAVVLKALIKDVENDDAGAVPLIKAAGILILPPNQSKAAFSLSGITVDDFEWAVGGRTERSVVTIPMRAEQCVESRVI
jgi:hypothetical protein